MKKRIIMATVLAVACFSVAFAQRSTDKLNRGLIAMKTTNGVYCSWRILGEEYFDVTYNLYRDGQKVNSTPLDVSNFTDAAGTASSTYTVKAVVRGKEIDASETATVWEKNYLTIVPQHDKSLTSTYVPNDACCADVDGDGELEILLKYDNESEMAASYPKEGINGEYSLFECLKLDGTVLWWVNCGPNMGDFQNNEQNIVAFDWDKDGKAEAVFRAADGTTIHMADGTVFTVGDATLNYRAATGGGTNWFMHSGKEYLLYVNGATGKPYQCIDYPLPRLEESENPNGLLYGSAYDSLVNTAWGDGYGHRSTKHFFGAPFLDGRNASIFIARGIYTRHKMIAYDVKPTTHELIERWRWNNSTPNDWYGQGYHNYSIADVDWDGRDEIVFGSMVIDDNGKGLSTSGLGHGDSHHVGDFDPYSYGQEFFGCNEDNPGNNFRNATTSKLYYRYSSGNDDGRANMGNFIDEYPGAQGVSSRDPNLVGGASHAAIVGSSKADVTITQNFRIYWDGDLCDESFDYTNGKNSQGGIFKAREGRIALLEGSKTNNDTKGTPCYQGDVLGDWREEVIMRDGQNNIRIYSTDIPTEYRNYTLWHDHQYRNAMVWQMCGYNQTPHVSYFLGKLEGITIAPPPLTMSGRTEVKANGTISKSLNDKHLILCENGETEVAVEDGAAPSILTVNTPIWTQGNGGNDIRTTTYTHTLTGGALTGEMRLVKQGGGTLTMPAATHTYTGNTDVWTGGLCLNGTLTNSHVWLNRFSRLLTTGGRFMKGIKMDYAAELLIGSTAAEQTIGSTAAELLIGSTTAEQTIGSTAAASSVTTTTLELGFGAIVNLDLWGETIVADTIKAEKLVIERKNWENGPQYLAPVLRLIGHNAAGARSLTSGKYLIGEISSIEGNLDDIIIEGLDDLKKTLLYEDGRLYINVQAFTAGNVTWTGSNNGNWDIDNTTNFVTTGTTTPIVFVPGDVVTFDDTAVTTDINLTANVKPGNVIFKNETTDYTLSGEGSIVGTCSLTKTGAGNLTISNINYFSGGTVVSGGKLIVGTVANQIGIDAGALGEIDNPITISDDATLAASASTTLGQTITLDNTGGNIEVPTGISLALGEGVKATNTSAVLTKTGGGNLTLATSNTVKKLVISNGSVTSTENGSSVIQLPETVEFLNGTLFDADNIYSYSSSSTNFVVPEGKTGNLYLDSRCDYRGKLTGKGTLNVYAQSVRGYLKGNWSAFEGTVSVNTRKTGSYDPDFLWDNTYGLPKATLNIPSGKTFNAQGNNVAIGNLKGTGTITTTGTLTIGARNEDISFTGTITGSPNVIKNGTGNWKPTKAIGTVKKVTVKEGALALPATLTSANSNINFVGTNIDTYIDGESALLKGQGMLSSVYLVNGGCIEPGYYGSATAPHYGTLTMSSLNIDKSSTASLYIRTNPSKTNTHSNLSVSGRFTFNGTLRLTIDASYSPAHGDEFLLWSAASFEGTPTIVLPDLPEGFSWDTTDLLKPQGIIRVMATDGIDSITADDAQRCDIFTLGGMKVKRGHIKSGIYLIRKNNKTTKVYIHD